MDQIIKLRDISDFETECHMTLEDFLEGVEDGAFIDYDGYGEFATDTKVSNVVIYPSDVEHTKFPDWVTHVCWYNR